MQTTTHIELSRREVAEKARRLWRADGCPSGRDLEYWLQAEVELLRHTYAARTGNRNWGADSRLRIPKAGGSHRVLAREGWPDYVFAFHDDEGIDLRMLARIARRTGLRPEDL
jgi:hypothetical protein